MLIGIDIGGTAIKVGALTDKGHILARDRLAFQKTMPFDGLLSAIIKVCRGLEEKTGEQAEAIGICMPGFIDRVSGLIVDGGGNVPALRTSSLPEHLSRAMGVPVRVENDGVAATLGELHFGAAQGFKRFVFLTIGTGVGGAVAIDGSVVTGSRGEPPELGAMVLDPKGDRQSRTLEQLACAGAFTRAFEMRSNGAAVPELPDLFRRAEGEFVARDAVDEVSRYIAQALGILINSLNLEACLIGGGVAGAGEILLAPIRAHLADFTWPFLLKEVKVLSASRGNDAGLLGAAWRALEAQKDQVSARRFSADANS